MRREGDVATTMRLESPKVLSKGGVQIKFLSVISSHTIVILSGLLSLNVVRFQFLVIVHVIAPIQENREW
jgi:hypothetical protein